MMKEIYTLKIISLLNSIFRTLNKSFTPTKQDIEGFKKILDKDGDGLVTYGDIEKTVFNFLLGEGPKIGQQ